MTTQKDAKKLGAVLEDIVFLPSPAQRKTKAAFWTVLNDNPIADKDHITMASVVHVTGDTRVHKWWGQEGFQEWFCNKDEFRQRLEYLAHLALDTVEEVLLDGEANANARMNAAKLMLEAARKMPDKNAKEQYLDESIHKMSKKELESYIKKALPSKEMSSEED